MFTLFAFLIMVIGDWTWGTTNDPNQLSLWKDGRQVGSWKIAERQYWALQGRSFILTQCPVDEPAPDKPMQGDPEKPDFVGPPDVKGEKPAVINYGMDLSKCPTEGEFFSYNGNPIGKAQSLALLATGDPQAGAKVDPDALTDDHQHYRLTVIGKGADKALEAIKGNPKWNDLGANILAADYKADSWHVKDKGYKQLNPDRPTVYFTDASGKVLLVEDFADQDAGALLDRIRKSRDPWSISWSSKWLGFNPLTWMIGFGWSSLHIPIEFVAGFIGMIIVAVLVIKKKPGPPQTPKAA